jgi:hypothetical protein
MEKGKYEFKVTLLRGKNSILPDMQHNVIATGSSPADALAYLKSYHSPRKIKAVYIRKLK